MKSLKEALGRELSMIENILNHRTDLLGPWEKFVVTVDVVPTETVLYQFPAEERITPNDWGDILHGWKWGARTKGFLTAMHQAGGVINLHAFNHQKVRSRNPSLMFQPSGLERFNHRMKELKKPYRMRSRNGEVRMVRAS